MRRILTALVLLAALTSVAAAQELDATKIFLGSTPCHLLSGSGSPEGAVTAPVCSTYYSTAGAVYLKASGSGNTGWTVMTAGMSGSGTSGYLAKWTGAQSLGNSIISESGSTVSIAGSVAATAGTFSGNVVTWGSWTVDQVGTRSWTHTASGGNYSLASGDHFGTFYLVDGGIFSVAMSTGNTNVGGQLTTNGITTTNTINLGNGSGSRGVLSWDGNNDTVLRSASGEQLILGANGETGLTFSPSNWATLASGLTTPNDIYARYLWASGYGPSSNGGNITFRDWNAVAKGYIETTYGGATFYGGLVVGDGSAQRTIALNAAVGTHAYIGLQKGGNWRWLLTSDTTAESGSMAGSNFGIYSYTDAGAYQRENLGITRSTGAWNIRHGVYGSGGLTITYDGNYPLRSYHDSGGVGWANGTGLYYMYGGAHRFYNGSYYSLDASSTGLTNNLGYTYDIGSLAFKYRALHAAELWVETLVAQDVMATIGGRVVVAPTTMLTRDIASGATTIYVKHNNLASGDRVRLESSGKVEFMSVDSGAGGSAGDYSYSVTRNLDGTGANDWYAGDAVLNTGTTGDGFIDLYSTSGVFSAYGPTIAGNVRNSGTYNDVSTAWAIGNLNGLYGYTSDTYGVGLGKFANGSSYLIATPTGGIRMYQRASGTEYERFRLAADGSGFVASSNIAWDTSGNTTIAGWSVNSAYLGTSSGSGAGMAPADYPFYAGAAYASRASAPFRVTTAGAVVMTSATITGSTINGVASSAIAGWAYSGDNTYINGAYIRTGTISADRLFVGVDRVALNEDPGFNDPTAWGLATSYEGTLFTTISDGQVGARVIQNTSGQQVWALPPKAKYIPVDPNKTYRVRVWLRETGGTCSDGTYMAVTLWDYSKTTELGYGPYWYYFVAAQNIGSAWTEYTGTFGYGTPRTIPSNGRWMAPGTGLNYYSSACVIQAQDFRIEEMSTGKVVIGNGGYLAQGQTDYNTGTGFWLGDASGTPKFSIGNSSGNRVTWDGTNITVVSANATINSSGVTVAPASSAAYNVANGYAFGPLSYGGKAGVFSYESSSSRALSLYNEATSTYTATAYLGAAHSGGNAAGVYVEANSAGKSVVSFGNTTIYGSLMMADGSSLGHGTGVIYANREGANIALGSTGYTGGIWTSGQYLYVANWSDGAKGLRVDLSSGRLWSYYGLEVGLGTTSIGSARSGRIGYSGGGYAAVGYGWDTTGTSGSYTYGVSDTASLLLFQSGGFQFYTAPSGTAGNAITFTQAFAVASSGVTTYVSLYTSSAGANTIGTSSTPFGQGYVNYLRVGSPSSASAAAGRIDAQAVYDDGTLLTDWVFDLAYDGRTSVPHAGRLWSLPDVEAITLRERRLPWMPTQGAFDAARSLGGMVTRLWEGQEQQQLHIFTLRAEIAQLRAQVARLMGEQESQR